MRVRKDALRKAMMGDWWDDWDVPASCEVQVEVVSEVSVKNLNVDVE